VEGSWGLNDDNRGGVEGTGIEYWHSPFDDVSLLFSSLEAVAIALQQLRFSFALLTSLASIASVSLLRSSPSFGVII